jgi:DNA-binding NtrC family response regulator
LSAPRSSHVPVTDAYSATSLLLVDDEPLVRRIVARVLREDGFRVMEAECAEDALRLLERESVDLVLTDIMMPRMNGCELGREISRRWPQLRMLYYSGHVFDALFSSGICPKDIPFIAKPLDPDVLKGRIQQVMEEPPYRFGD